MAPIPRSVGAAFYAPSEVRARALKLGYVVQLKSLRIRNFRTVGSEQTIELVDGMTIVGPNNSGKTNILRAVEMLFTGHDNLHGYDRGRDLTFSAGAKVKTSLLATFGGDPDDETDARIFEQFDELHSILGTERAGDTFTLSLQFTESSNALYQFFPNVKKPPSGAQRTQYSRVERRLTQELLALFECHYVPSAKSVADLYSDLLIPFLRRLAAEALRPHIAELHNALAKVASEMNDGLARAGLSEMKASFSFPDGSEEAVFTGFDLELADPEKTPLSRKGQGIQSTALLASFLWITREEARAGRSTIWLLEEPESYLHPELSHACRALLDELRRESLVVVTTHSLSFVPQDPRAVCGTELDSLRTRVSTFQTYSEATERIRGSLGVRFSDYYNLGTFNVLVEGKSDREAVGWALGVLSVERTTKGWPNLRAAMVLDFGGVTHLAGFLRATYRFIRDERSVVAMFDGDEAGNKERQALQGYFGKVGVGFEPNRDFVSVRDRFAIEALFPDNWIIEHHDKHPGRFETFAVDVHGSLEPFRIKSGSKAQVFSALMRRAEGSDIEEWADRWIALFDAIDDALGAQHKRLSATRRKAVEDAGLVPLELMASRGEGIVVGEQ